MKFEKVVFVRYYSLTKAIYTDMYMPELIANNIKVEYLDVTDLFYPERIKVTPYDFDGTIKISSYKHLKQYLSAQSNEKVLYISIMTFEWTVFKLFRVFTKFKLNLGVFSRGVFPNGSVDAKSEIKRILKVISPERVKLFLANKLTYLAKKTGYIKSYDYIFTAGEFGHYGLGLGSEIDFKKTKFIDVNTVDYDQFLLHKKKPVDLKDDYIVFLDQYLPYHPDAAFNNIKTVEAERYYRELNAFFDSLETETGKKIIIAAHPKAERYREFNPFNNRPIFFNKSNDLVKEAAITLTHASTAICFPICYGKRIILLISDYLDDVLPHFTVTAKAIVQACDATLLEMDKQGRFEIPDDINHDKYNDFKYKYLTSLSSENQLSKDIFLAFFKK
jgi:hypothetical protein